MIQIYHNPNCGTSRQTIELLREHHIEFETILYLQTPPSQAQLKELLKQMQMGVRELLRQKGTPYEELDLSNEKWSDEELLHWMVKHPILINRPIVVTPKGARLCRPKERVFEILDLPPLPKAP